MDELMDWLRVETVRTARLVVFRRNRPGSHPIEIQG
jgi:hypothetical protein